MNNISAWDIAGAIVWTFLAFINSSAVVYYIIHLDEIKTSELFVGILFSTILHLASFYCIARIFGAHN